MYIYNSIVTCRYIPYNMQCPIVHHRHNIPFNMKNFIKIHVGVV